MPAPQGIMKPLLVAMVLLQWFFSGHAQTITNAEYFFDTDPGPGNATPITGISADDTLGFSASISTTGLSQGFHFLAIRVKDSNNRWSHFEKRGFFIQVAPTQMQDIVAAECFFDLDPGPGNGTPISIGSSGDSINFMAMIPPSLPGGFHTLVIRVLDEDGIWSLFERRSFYVQATPAGMVAIVEAEYFINVDPGVGNGIPIPIGTSDDTIMPAFSILIPESTPLGEYLYGIRVKDLDDHWSLFQYDTVKVAISVPEDTVLNAAPGLCSKMVNGLDPIVLNSEPYSYTLTGATTGSGSGTVSGFTFNAGITTVTYTLTNFPTAFGSFTISIIDAEIPSITCPANITVGSDSGVCGAEVDFDVMISDNCPNPVLTLLSGLASGSMFPTGTTTNTFRVTDASGNSTTCSFTVTVTDDLPPSISCPSNVTVHTDAGLCTASNVMLGTPVTNDNCGVASTTNNGLSTYPLGVTNVTWTTTDVNGLTATCIQTVTVADNQNPIVTCPANITMNADPGTCTKTVTYSASATDNCGISGIAYSPTSGSSFSVGTTIVTATATDVNGRTSSCTFTVTIADSEDPVITCPPDLTVSAQFGSCAKNVTLGAEATDNCGTPTITFIPASGSSFPVGTTIVTATATDGGGRTDTCTFTVTVQDDQPPQITCPSNITVNTDPGICTASNVVLGSPVANDNCGVAMASNNGLSIYPVGVTNVIWTVTDVNGLTASCFQTVTVIDTQSPMITLCPENIVVNVDPGNCGGTATFSFSGTDNCGLASILSTTFQSGEQFPVGISNVTILATDVHGNTSTCTFTVEVIDNELPEITCPANISIATAPGLCSNIVSYNINASDNCLPLTSLVTNPPSGSSFPVGTTMVTSTATDASGNTASCTFQVIIEDEQPPSIQCPAPITVNTDPELCTVSGVSLGTPFTGDNCGVATTINNSLSDYPLGATNVTWTVTDIYGLTASCIQTVTVVDNQPPQIICPADMTVFAGPGNTTIVNYDAPQYADNCPFVNMTQTAGLPSGSAFPLGITLNTFEATDANGLTASCSFTITLRKGKVGINTTSPLAMLHVVDTNVVFTRSLPLPSNPGPPPVEGSGARMMWYPDKAAFRAGAVQGSQWDKDSIGLYSFAVGINTKAKGVASVAWGNGASALDSCSVAFGNSATASGKRAVAFGFLTNSAGENALAFGNGSKANAQSSMSSGSNSEASGIASFSYGNDARAFGDYSFATGESTWSRGRLSAAFGFITDARPYSTLALGRFNDTTAVNLTAWDPMDPLFIIGNGTSTSARTNAVTLLKNGKLGLSMIQPEFRLQISSNDQGSGGIVHGILLENTNADGIGEAAISWKNNALPSAKKWIAGLNQSSMLGMHYESVFEVSGARLRLDTLGRVTNGRWLPLANLHLVRSDTTGGPKHSSSKAVFESTLDSWIQFSSATSAASGILSGNQSTPLRSAILFAADSSIVVKTGGGMDSILISKTGNLAIGEDAPSTRLAVKGTTRLGTNGTALQEIIKATVNVNVPSVSNNSSVHVEVLITNVAVGSNVIVSPGALLSAGFILAGARVKEAGKLEVTFTNKSGGPVDPPATDYYFAIIR